MNELKTLIIFWATSLMLFFIAREFSKLKKEVNKLKDKINKRSKGE